jgi:hypothetical protein
MYTAVEGMVPDPCCKVDGMPRPPARRGRLATCDALGRWRSTTATPATHTPQAREPASARGREREEQRPDWQPREGAYQTHDESARKDDNVELTIEPEEREKVR